MLQSPSKTIIIVVQLIFLGINMFLALLRPHFNPRYARAKMSLNRAKNIFMPANINSIVILNFVYGFLHLKCIIKQLLDSVFVIIQIINVEVR